MREQPDETRRGGCRSKRSWGTKERGDLRRKKCSERETKRGVRGEARTAGA